MECDEASETLRLDHEVYPLNSVPEAIQSEGDATRDFQRNFAIAVALAWPFGTQFQERDLAGPLGHTTEAATIDKIHIMSVRLGNHHNLLLLAAGDLKKPGVIQPAQWRGAPRSAGTRRLGREIRGYAYMYNTPLVYIYDGRCFLIVVFKGSGREKIKAADCPVECVVLPRRSDDELHCTIRYALYRLVWRGWMRQAQTHGLPVQYGNYRREYQWWSGRPVWINLQNGERVYGHPAGLTRVFDKISGAWYWAINGEPVVDAEGHGLWDTECMLRAV